MFGLALAVRLLFSLLMAGTYDADEFVYLALGRDVAHGALPYRDFPFFHPPGVLFIFGGLDSLTQIWWPLSRLADVLMDCVTTLLVWLVGVRLFGRGPALAAAVLYAVSPVVLVSAVRVDQEIPMTLLCLLGLALLVTRRSSRAALAAGACLALACWIKYPMLLFLPAHLLAAARPPPGPADGLAGDVAARRLAACASGFLIAAALLFLPYLGAAHQLLDYTVHWQLLGRTHMPAGTRISTTLIFWLGVNVFAVAGIVWQLPGRGGIRLPAWLLAAFATGVVFPFTSVTYSHYFVPIEPYAALLGGPVVAALVAQLPRIRFAGVIVLAGSLALATLWAASIMGTGLRQYFITSDAAAVQRVVQALNRLTPAGTPILTNRFEYAYLAGRPWVAHYFWNDNTVVSARDLEQRLPATGAVVLSSYRDWSPYPAGLVPYLNARCQRIMVADSAIWLINNSRRRH